MILYIIRHGDPDYKTDSLTPKGAAQAEALGKRLFDSGIQQIYSSPLGRAQETAAPACRLLGLPCQIEPWAHEISESRMASPPSDGIPLYNFQNTCFLENGNAEIGLRDALTCPHVALYAAEYPCAYHVGLLHHDPHRRNDPGI